MFREKFRYTPPCRPRTGAEWGAPIPLGGFLDMATEIYSEIKKVTGSLGGGPRIKLAKYFSIVVSVENCFEFFNLRKQVM
jgi:hypothetical protein